MLDIYISASFLFFVRTISLIPLVISEILNDIVSTETYFSLTVLLKISVARFGRHDHSELRGSLVFKMIRRKINWSITEMLSDFELFSQNVMELFK